MKKSFILNLRKIKKIKSFGDSMRPLLLDGDIIFFKKIAISKIKVNDILTGYKNNKYLATHRVIYKTPEYLITKGDNNLKADNKIYPKQIIGKVYQVQRNNKIINPENIYLIQSTLYFQEICKIKKLFEKNKIDFVFLKGLPLHLHFEKTHPRRIYLDCDVLVKKKDFIKAQKILVSCGYKKADNYLSNIQKKLKNKEIENTYYKNINGFIVVFDLHLEIVFLMTQLGELNTLYPQQLIDKLTNEFLKTKRTVTVNSEKFLILDSDFLILYLALHFFHHNYSGAYRLEFLDKIIRKYKIDPKLIQIIKKYQLENFVYLSFVLSKKYYHSSISGSFLDSIKPSRNKLNYMHQINPNIFNDESRTKAGINRFKNLFYLSPNHFIDRLSTFINFGVIYYIFYIFTKSMVKKCVMIIWFLLNIKNNKPDEI